MTNCKHTPGPWVADDGDMSDGLNWVVAQKSTGAVLAEIVCEAPDSTLETWEANARLMAAAPDLLAALERVARECSLPASNGVRLTSEAMLTAIGNYARAAIAKATKE